MGHQIIWPKIQGKLRGDLPSVTQGSTLETLTIGAFYSDGTGVSLTGKTITATATDEAGNTTSITGTLTGGASQFTWALSEGDIGTDGTYTLIVTYTDGVKSWASDPARFTVLPNPAADSVQNPALVGIGADDAAWVVAAAAGGLLGELAYIDDADSDGTQYVRKDGGWEAITIAGAASEITFTPAGSIEATDVQAAIQELDDETDARLDILEAALIPVAVDDMTATATGEATIDLAWTYTAGAAISGFKVYRKTGIGGTYALIDTAGSGDTTFGDTGLSALTEYYYRLDAFNTFFTATGNEDNATTTLAELNQAIDAGDITPTFGSELVTNGDMELDASWINAGTPVTNERSTEQVHAGTYSRKLVGDGNGDGITQLVPVTSGLWYRMIGWIYVAAAAAGIQAASGQLPLVSGNFSTAAWTESKLIGRAVSTANTTMSGLQRGVGNATAYFDDFSIKALTLATSFLSVGDILRKTGTWRSTPTVEAGTQAGIVLNYADANNFVLAYVNRYDGKAYLDKRIGGTWSNVINGAITYGAAKELAVVASGTNYSLYYDGTQIGSTTAITDAGVGTAVYGFATDVANAVGTVRTDPATTYAPA